MRKEKKFKERTEITEKKTEFTETQNDLMKWNNLKKNIQLKLKFKTEISDKKTVRE